MLTEISAFVLEILMFWIDDLIRDRSWGFISITLELWIVTQLSIVLHPYDIKLHVTIKETKSRKFTLYRRLAS